MARASQARWVARKKWEGPLLQTGIIACFLILPIAYTAIPGLSREVSEKLARVRPVTLGQAARIPGITPAAVAILDIYLSKSSDSVDGMFHVEHCNRGGRGGESYCAGYRRWPVDPRPDQHPGGNGHHRRSRLESSPAFGSFQSPTPLVPASPGKSPESAPVSAQSRWARPLVSQE